MSITCREFLDFIMSYLDEDLAGGQRAVFEEHLSDCPPCLQYLDSYRDTVAMERCVCRDRSDPPDDAPELLVQAILAARRVAR